MSNCIRVAIVGVGNCCSSLIQGLNYYDNNNKHHDGLVRKEISGYGVKDVEIVTAIDVDERKINRPLSQAIFSPPNCTTVFQKQIKENCKVLKGPFFDSISNHMNFYNDECNHSLEEVFNVNFSEESTLDIKGILKGMNIDILINYLPVGSQKTTEFYADLCLELGISFLNCIPVFIASNPSWERKFYDANIPIVGDDMKSQFGASILSQMLQELALDRGLKVKCHIQDNVGGNTDFLNMMNPDRIKSKKISKENVIRFPEKIRNIETDENSCFIYAGPSQYIRYYKDNKKATFRLELEGFGGSEILFEGNLSVIDSPNSAGVVIDAIRYLKVARDLNLRGSLRGVSAYTQKTPPKQMLFKDAKFECDMLSQGKITNIIKQYNI